MPGAWNISGKPEAIAESRRKENPTNMDVHANM